MRAGKGKRGSSELKHKIALFVLLYGFWLILSGKPGLKYVTIGFVTSLAVVIVTQPLMKIKPIRGERGYAAYDLPYIRCILYLPWLMWQIVQANIDVAIRVLHPKLPIEPRIITFKKEMSHPAAHTTLGNSITLTPGTVTLDIEGETYIVHALTEGAARGLVPEEGEGEMPAKVARVFGEEPEGEMEREMMSASERGR